MVKTKSNLPKKTVITNKPKTKNKVNKRVNKLELTVRLHENYIKTKIFVSKNEKKEYFLLVEKEKKWYYKIDHLISYPESNYKVTSFLSSNKEVKVKISSPYENKLININNLQLFNENNEKLSLITLEI